MSTDESLAKALGIELIDGRFNCGKPVSWPWDTSVADYHMHTMECEPHWTEDMNACLRDIVPVLRARGLCVRITDVSDLAAFLYDWHVDIRRDSVSVAAHGGISLPAAFCEAALKALEATNV